MHANDQSMTKADSLHNRWRASPYGLLAITARYIREEQKFEKKTNKLILSVNNYHEQKLKAKPNHFVFGSLNDFPPPDPPQSAIWRWWQEEALHFDDFNVRVDVMWNGKLLYK